MSAALLLLPWVGATYDRAQIRQWQISADRLSAGVVVGIDYPTPAHVSHVLGMLLDACAEIQEATNHNVTCEDPSDLVGSIREIHEQITDAGKERDDESERADAAEKRAEEQEERADQAVKERDSFESQRDAAEASLDSLRAELREHEATIKRLTNKVGEMIARETRIGDSMRLLADALREDT